MLSVAIASVVSLLMLITGVQTRDVAIAMLVMLLADALMAISGPWQMALEKELHISRLTLVTLTASVISSILAILLAVSGQGLMSLLTMSVVTSLVSTAGIIIAGRKRLPHLIGIRWQFDYTLARQMISQGLAAGLSLTLLVTVVGQYDNFLIGTFVGKETLGFYDRAYRIAIWPNILLTIATARVGLQMMARLRDDAPRLTHTVRLWLWMVTSLGIPMSLVLCFGASEIINLLYGSRYAESVGYLQFLALSNLAWTFISVAFWLSVAMSNRRMGAVMSLVQAGVIVIIATPLTLELGVTGTMIGVGVSMLVAMVLGCRYIFSTVSLTAREVFGASSVSAAITVIVLLGFTQTGLIESLPQIGKLMIVIMASFGIYILCLIAVRREETLERLAYLTKAWRRVK